MTRLSKRELERKLDVIEDVTAPGASVLVTVGGGVDDAVLDAFRVRTCHEEDDPITHSEEVAVPKHLPRSYRDGITCLTHADIVELWRTMPEDTLAAERAYRAENDLPLPPYLEAQTSQ